MLSKTARLNRQQFSDIFKVGKRIHTPALQVIATKSDCFHGSVVISKKVYKKAVDRNKVRRQLYAYLYQYNKTHILQNTLILIAKPALSTMSITQVKEDLTIVLQKLPSVSKTV